MTTGADLAADLIESDCRYFDAGATLAPLDGGVLASMPGLERVLGAAVLQRVSPADLRSAPDDWVSAAVSRFQALGCAAARVYVQEVAGPLIDALVAAGFRRRVEIGYLAPASRSAHEGVVELRAIKGEDDWEAKRKLHAGADVAADGHATAAEDWVELEQRKSEGGQMTPYFIEVDGDVCGGVSTLEVGGVLRAKNVFVHPDRRRTGIATATMHLLSRRAAEMGKDALGIFGVPGNPGNAVYVRLGMEPAVRQYEWTLRLPA